MSRRAVYRVCDVRVTALYAPGDVRVDHRPPPSLVSSTDVLVQVRVGGLCGSDLWWYRGANRLEASRLMGHEVVGTVVEVGEAVSRVRPGRLVVVPFAHADGTCGACRRGMHSACGALGSTVGGQGEYVRVAHADACLLVVEAEPDARLLRSLLTLADVMPTGWHAAVSAGVGPGCSVVVVGDGAVGLCAVLAARVLGAEVVVALSSRASRQEVATAFGATHVLPSRGSEAVQEVRAFTGGWGADAVLECVGTAESLDTAIHMARPGGRVGFVGIPHGGPLELRPLFQRNVGLHGGITPVQRYLPELAELVLSGAIDPGRVIDCEVELGDVAAGYRAMHDRSAIKVLVHP